MMIDRKICATFVAGLLLMSFVPFVAAAAQGECVRVLGFESDAERQSMDPAELLGTDNAYHVQAVYEPLVDRDSGMEPYPVLAESWESNTDGTQWTFHLRRGVKFHDGSDFDSGDVVYSINRILDPTISPGGSQVHGFLEGGKIEAVDTHTVRISLPKPIVELPQLIATKWTMMVPEGAKVGDLRRQGVGTGPFMQEQFTIGGPVRVLRRNPSYWQAGLPKSECLEIRIITEPTSRAAAIMANEADLALVVDPVTLTTLAKHPDVELIPTSGATALFLAMWTDTPPFDDPRVRTAMKLVVDREAIVQTVLLGYGEPGNDVPISPSSPKRLSPGHQATQCCEGQTVAGRGRVSRRTGDRPLHLRLLSRNAAPGHRVRRNGERCRAQGQRHHYAGRGLLGHRLAEISAGRLLHGGETTG